jgi:vacuolar-type H+-ATPase subunit I/STV1
MELSAAQQLLNVVSLDLKGLPDQQARFEAFRLDPLNKDLSQEDLLALFTDEERSKFGNSQDPADPQTPAQKAREKQATAQAKEKLSKMQSEWNATRTEAKTPLQLEQERQAYQEEVYERISNFGGIQVNLSAQGDNGEKFEGAMQFALNDDDQIQEIVEAVADPLGWWDDMLYNTGVLTEGQKGFDATKFAQLVTVITHREQLLNNAYQQGREDYKASLLKTSRNVSIPGNALGGATTPPPGQMTEKQESVKEAMKVAGII